MVNSLYQRNSREVAGKLVQSLWRGFHQVGKEEAKTVVQHKQKGFRTLEIEGGNPPPHQVSHSEVMPRLVLTLRLPRFMAAGKQGAQAGVCPGPGGIAAA